MARGQTRRAMQGPLYGAGAYVIANDMTGVGVADDVAIPFLALGAVAVVLATTAPASSRALQRALDDVKGSATTVSEVFSRVEDNDKPIAAPGSRQHCIDMYVDCKLNARRGFRGCQACMDWCMGAPYRWPETKACDYTRSFLEDMPPVRIKR